MNKIFRVEGGPLAEAIKNITAERERIGEEYISLNDQLGSETIHTWPWTGRFAGCAFAKGREPSLVDWRRSHNMWVPRKNTPIGRATWACIRMLTPLPAVQTVLEQYGLTVHKPQLDCASAQGPSFVEGFGHVGVYYVHVPWFEVSQDVKDLVLAIGDPTPDMVFLDKWVPPADWVEVTVGQKLLEWDQLNRDTAA